MTYQTKAYLYIDTRGHSRDTSRNAPQGARVAFHTHIGVVELQVEPGGAWRVLHGPPLSEAGDYREVASGALAPAPAEPVAQQEVYILSIETKYGTDRTAHRTEAGAMAEAAAFVRENWSERDDLEADAPADDSEAVATYFDEATREFYSITTTLLED